ncbi:hypothetical protein [Georgenia thermotolerans]|uniref:hypothetical protein n=1 Tax=Georgenia thermotolerans TaxID=527326 RepID=UPI001B8D70F7|nr:hypothetical protein [Georgenia thermotolerans]
MRRDVADPHLAAAPEDHPPRLRDLGLRGRRFPAGQAGEQRLVHAPEARRPVGRFPHLLDEQVGLRQQVGQVDGEAGQLGGRQPQQRRRPERGEGVLQALLRRRRVDQDRPGVESTGDGVRGDRTAEPGEPQRRRQLDDEREVARGQPAMHAGGVGWHGVAVRGGDERPQWRGQVVGGKRRHGPLSVSASSGT